MTIYYHLTDDAEAVVRAGFRDPDEAQWITPRWLTGVFLSDWPVGARGSRALEVEFPSQVDLSEWSIMEYGSVAEWCVPAALISERATVRLLAAHEVDGVVRARAFVRQSRGS